MIKERPTREELARARKYAQKILVGSEHISPEYKEMLKTFIRFSAPIEPAEIEKAFFDLGGDVLALVERLFGGIDDK